MTVNFEGKNDQLKNGPITCRASSCPRKSVTSKKKTRALFSYTLAFTRAHANQLAAIMRSIDHMRARARAGSKCARQWPPRRRATTSAVARRMTFEDRKKEKCLSTRARKNQCAMSRQQHTTSTRAATTGGSRRKQRRQRRRQRRRRQ